MYAYGIRGNAFKLLKSYLTNRTQFVVYDGIPSCTLPINCGVPQVSVQARPLLFIISMNDVGNVSDFLYTILYADDTSILLRQALLLDKLSVWLTANINRHCHCQKTYYVVFHGARIKIDKHPVVTMDMCLNKTESLKYLGMIIDHKLDWTSHMAHAKNKISKDVSIMLRARNYVTRIHFILPIYNYILI